MADLIREIYGSFEEPAREIRAIKEFESPELDAVEEQHANLLAARKKAKTKALQAKLDEQIANVRARIKNIKIDIAAETEAEIAKRKRLQGVAALKGEKSPYKSDQELEARPKAPSSEVTSYYMLPEEGQTLEDLTLEKPPSEWKGMTTTEAYWDVRTLGPKPVTRPTTMKPHEPAPPPIRSFEELANYREARMKAILEATDDPEIRSEIEQIYIYNEHPWRTNTIPVWQRLTPDYIDRLWLACDSMPDEPPKPANWDVLTEDEKTEWNAYVREPETARLKRAKADCFDHWFQEATEAKKFYDHITYLVNKGCLAFGKGFPGGTVKITVGERFSEGAGQQMSPAPTPELNQEEKLILEMMLDMYPEEEHEDIKKAALKGAKERYMDELALAERQYREGKVTRGRTEQMIVRATAGEKEKESGELITFNAPYWATRFPMSNEPRRRFSSVSKLSCPKCGGSGEFKGKKCPKCEGKGVVFRKKGGAQLPTAALKTTEMQKRIVDEHGGIVLGQLPEGYGERPDGQPVIPAGTIILEGNTWPMFLTPAGNLYQPKGRNEVKLITRELPPTCVKTFELKGDQVNGLERWIENYPKGLYVLQDKEPWWWKYQEKWAAEIAKREEERLRRAIRIAYIKFAGQLREEKRDAEAAEAMRAEEMERRAQQAAVAMKALESMTEEDFMREAVVAKGSSAIIPPKKDIVLDKEKLKKATGLSEKEIREAAKKLEESFQFPSGITLEWEEEMAKPKRSRKEKPKLVATSGTPSGSTALSEALEKAKQAYKEQTGLELNL